ncbi:MAG: hypothetical protein HKK67_04500 [Chlorobiaceae bacterium]|nr:hypothetical protein [Chlorobiaceae bacterium]
MSDLFPVGGRHAGMRIDLADAEQQIGDQIARCRGRDDDIAFTCVHEPSRHREPGRVVGIGGSLTDETIRYVGG